MCFDFVDCWFSFGLIVCCFVVCGLWFAAGGWVFLRAVFCVDLVFRCNCLCGCVVYFGVAVVGFGGVEIVILFCCLWCVVVVLRCCFVVLVWFAVFWWV